MTRIEHAERLDAAERAEARARGRLARLHNRPLGGCLEPKHKSSELGAAFRAGWHEEAEAIAAAE